MQQFPITKRIMLPSIPVAHIDHGDFGALWNGDGDGWRQLGTVSFLGTTIVEEVPNGQPVRLRLTDTLHGESAECTVVLGVDPIPKEILTVTPAGIRFKGTPIGHHHVHVAYWRDANEDRVQEDDAETVASKGN
jgi:hypothetical protein